MKNRSFPIADDMELRADAEWIGRVARRILRANPAFAEEMAQEAAVAAWRTPPSDAPVRPWLLRVLRNAIMSRQREDRRRRMREAGAIARIDPPSDAADLAVARMESQRRVIDAVLALPDLYRRTVVLRYYEELDSREIAARLGVAPGTVRSRLKRAMEMLRRDLGDDEQSLAFVALAIPGSGVGLGNGVVATMKLIAGTNMKSAMIGVVAIVLAGVWLLAPPRGAPSDRSASVEDGVVGRAVSPSMPEPILADGEESKAIDRIEVPSTSEEVDVSSVGVFAIDYDVGKIRGRVVSAADGGPVVDASVSCASMNSAVTHARQSDVAVDDAGYFSVDVIDTGAHVLSVHSPSHVDRQLRDVRGGEFITLMLASGIEIAGVVLDDETGRPIARAEVEFGAPTVVTDAAGRFALVAPPFSLEPAIHCDGYASWWGAPSRFESGLDPDHARDAAPPLGRRFGDRCDGAADRRGRGAGDHAPGDGDSLRAVDPRPRVPLA